MSVSDVEKQKILWLCDEKRFKKFKKLIESALKTWELKTPCFKSYGLYYKAGNFAVREKCCLISAALNEKPILENLYNASTKLNRFYEFCAEVHFNLTSAEISGLSWGFDGNLFKEKIDKNAYNLGLSIFRILNKSK